MIKSIVTKSCTYVLSRESNYFQIHKCNIFSISKPDWRHFRDFQPYTLGNKDPLLNVPSFFFFFFFFFFLLLLLLLYCPHMHGTGRLGGLAVVCWTADNYHPCSNLGVGISEGCFVFHFISLSLEVARPI